MSPKIVGKCPDCGQEFTTKPGLNAHVGTTRCRAFSHEDEGQPLKPFEETEVAAGESINWRRKRVFSTGQNVFVRR